MHFIKIQCNQVTAKKVVVLLILTQPPQKTMADHDEGHFQINGQGAQLVFANNNGKVQTPLDPKS